MVARHMQWTDVDALRILQACGNDADESEEDNGHRQHPLCGDSATDDSGTENEDDIDVRHSTLLGILQSG